MVLMTMWVLNENLLAWAPAGDRFQMKKRGVLPDDECQRLR